MGLSVAVSHLRSPPPRRFPVATPSLGPENPAACFRSRLFGWKPTKAWPPPRTTTTRRGRQDDFQGRKGSCQAHLAEDAPFAVGIGASILSSLVFPVPTDPDDGAEDGGGGGIDSTDTRFAVMGILSFIPYFNWMSWVFAWLDTGNQRYLVYSIVYLAPYFRTNFSLSPNDSWLPIASILACIFHIQLEASMRSGDVDGIPMFGETLKHLSPPKRKDGSDRRSYKEIHKEEESRKMPGEGEFRRKSVDDVRPRNEKEDLNEERN